MTPRLHPIGERRDMTPIAPRPDATRWFEAGPLRIGVEQRIFNGQVLGARVADDPDAKAITDALLADKGVEAAELDDAGVSVHVVDAATGHEHLRFDGFGHDPHYHYITPGSHHVAVGYDETANGDFVDWVFTVLGARAPQMLELAGATELAARVEPADLAAALTRIRAEAGLDRR